MNLLLLGLVLIIILFCCCLLLLLLLIRSRLVGVGLLFIRRRRNGIGVRSGRSSPGTVENLGAGGTLGKRRRRLWRRRRRRCSGGGGGRGDERWQIEEIRRVEILEPQQVHEALLIIGGVNIMINIIMIGEY